MKVSVDMLVFSGKMLNVICIRETLFLDDEIHFIEFIYKLLCSSLYFSCCSLAIYGYEIHGNALDSVKNLSLQYVTLFGCSI